MRLAITLSIIAITALTFTSCEKLGTSVVPSGNITKEEKSVNNFYGVDISDAFNAYITFSKGPANVVIEANENLHNYIEVKNIGDRLSVGMKDRINIRRGSATLKVHITCEQLSNLEASGASNITLHDVLDNENTHIELSGASNLNGDINTVHLQANLSGASNLTINGNTTSLDLDASGASNLKDYNLNVEYFDADLSGASNAQLTVTKELKVEASGASNVRYKGYGTVKKQDLSGASNIKKVN